MEYLLPLQVRPIPRHYGAAQTHRTSPPHRPPGIPCGMPPAVSARRNALTCPIRMAKPRVGCGDTAPGPADRPASTHAAIFRCTMDHETYCHRHSIANQGPGGRAETILANHRQCAESDFSCDGGTNQSLMKAPTTVSYGLFATLMMKL